MVAHGDVEHYRPKSIYWWLAYTYDNYLYACQICNQVYKSDNFPISGTLFPAPAITDSTNNTAMDTLAGHISPDPIDIFSYYLLQTYHNAHLAEGAYLLNPYFDDPVLYLAYQADDVIEEVKVVPVDAAADLYIKAMEDFYGINRIELKNFRYQIFRIFRTLKKAYDESTDPAFQREIKKELDRMLADKFLFSGMNRYFNSRL